MVDTDFIKVFTAVKMSCAVSTLRKDVRKGIGKDFTGVGSSFAICAILSRNDKPVRAGVKDDTNSLSEV